MDTGVVLKSIYSANYYLDSKEKRYAFFLFILLLLSSILDIFGLASLIPVIMTASKPGSVYESEYLFKIYQFFHFSNEKEFVLALVLFIFVFFGLKNLFLIWINYKQALFTAEVALKIIENQYTKYINLPFIEFNRWGSAFIINSTINIPNSYVFGILRPVFIILSELTIIIVVLIGIVYFNPVLFLILLIVLLPSTLITYRALKNKSQKIGDGLNDIKPLNYKLVVDAFTGYIELKLADKQVKFKQKLLEVQKATQKMEAQAYLYTQIPLRVIEMVAILGVVTIFIYSLLFSDNPQQILTIVGLFAAAAYRLMPSVNRLITSLVTIKQYGFTIEDMERYRNFVDSSKMAVNQELLEFNYSIEFKNLSFTFPGTVEPTLKNINLKINKGERVGLIGSSGSGKTTLLNILLRFLTEDEGCVLIDNVPLSPKNIKSWYKLIGYVKQDTFLMDASIKDNITLGEENVDIIRLNYSLEQASLTSFINDLPEGIDTFIGERGSRLSGGQRQRIGIARALYKETKILLFDEATSALDNETEKEVNEAIDKLPKNSITIFMIAHRITTLKECDRIFELKDGVIIAEHSYSDLIKTVI